MGLRMTSPNQDSKISAAAGLSGGTGFAGIVLLLPEGTLKSIFLILAPTITIVFSSFWHIVTQEVDAKVADWRIGSQKKKAMELLDNLKKEKDIDQGLVDNVKKAVDDLTMVEVEITKRRVNAIVSAQ